MSATKTTGKDFTVSYRLGAPYDGQLRAGAEAAGVTLHQYARLVLVQHFENADVLEVKAELKGILAELRSFRAEFNAALE